MFPAFVIFFIAAIAETQRPPFDLPEAEGELVAGFHTEYSGAKFAMFFLAEFMNVITMSAVIVTMFLGGPRSGARCSASRARSGASLPIVYFVGKVFIFIFVFIWLRATLPRMRYDRLMDLGWKVMLPLGMIWVMADRLRGRLRQAADQRPSARRWPPGRR
jgi:NADH-quinone oxidoreductase subunit H